MQHICSFLSIHPPPELLPVLGQLEQIWVIRQIGLRSFFNWVSSFLGRAQRFSEARLVLNRNKTPLVIFNIYVTGTSGQFYIQRMLTPQMSIVKPITNQSLADLTCPPYGRIHVIIF